jgi:hypothetical protein
VLVHYYSEVSGFACTKDTFALYLSVSLCIFKFFSEWFCICLNVCEETLSIMKDSSFVILKLVYQYVIFKLCLLVICLLCYLMLFNPLYEDLWRIVWWLVNTVRKQRERERRWPNLRYYHAIFLEGLRIICLDYRTSVWDLNMGLPNTNHSITMFCTL